MFRFHSRSRSHKEDNVMGYRKLALSVLVPATLSLLAFATPNAHAQLTSVGPFTGDETETFESFLIYTNNITFHQVEPISIFGGGATLTSADARIAIYAPSAGATFGLVFNGSAQVADGVNGAGLNSFADTATITFASDVSQFGGYFGAASYSAVAAPITLSFFDDNNTLIGAEVYNYDHTTTADGILDFVGFASTTNVKTVTIGGDFVVFDGLQANIAPTAPPPASTPEPGALAFLVTSVLTGVGFLAQRRKQAHKAV